MFGIKDLFTTINLLGGAAAICLCIDGRPFAAGVAIILGYVFGDMLDGWVARKLNSANQFGAEFDTIADHTSHVIAPAAVVYTVYKDAGLVGEPWDRILAAALASSMIITVSIRHARNIVAPVEVKGVWAGLPRSVYGFLAIGYCNSYVAPDLPGGWWLGVAMIPLLGIGTLTYVPFPSHRIARKHFWPIRLMMATSLLGTPAIAILWEHLLFDWMFFWMALYCLIGWATMTTDERAAYDTVVVAAKAQAASAK